MNLRGRGAEAGLFSVTEQGGRKLHKAGERREGLFERFVFALENAWSLLFLMCGLVVIRESVCWGRQGGSGVERI